MLITVLDSLITVTGVVATWLSSRRNTLTWPVNMVSQALWVYVALKTQQWAFLPASGLYITLSVLGWRHWSRTKSSTRTLPSAEEAQ